MPENNPDLDQNAPDDSGLVLVIIDMINDLEFAGADALFGPALRAAERIAALKQRATEVGVPVVYANDNFGRWRSDFREVVEHCLTAGVRGGPIAELLKPAPEDYFVVKPKHSAFYATPLELLLEYLGCRHLILCGISGNMCVQFTACDAYLRDYSLSVPEDCMASNTAEENQRSLEYMQSVLKVDTTPSTRLDIAKLHQSKST